MSKELRISEPILSFIIFIGAGVQYQGSATVGSRKVEALGDSVKRLGYCTCSTGIFIEAHMKKYFFCIILEIRTSYESGAALES